MLQKVKPAIRKFRPKKEKEPTLLLPPPKSPDLAPSDFLKSALRGRRIADDEKLKHRVHEELRRFSKEF